MNIIAIQKSIVPIAIHTQMFRAPAFKRPPAVDMHTVAYLAPTGVADRTRLPDPGDYTSIEWIPHQTLASYSRYGCYS